MDWVVLAKVVPDVENVRFDPAQGRMVREGVELFLNPFDQRALRVALDLREPGERTTVVSMGPPGAAGALREARKLGADRAVLVSDPRLAGSDTFVTARVLASALERIGPAMVLAGRWTTDSDTGQVPPQVAVRRALPIVTDARKMARLPDGRWEVEVDTEVGWARARVPAPALVSVGEKIAKIQKLLPDEALAARSLEVETWDLGVLGVLPDEVGVAASPTSVERLIEPSPDRTPQILAEGSVADRVASAWHVLERRGAHPAPPPVPTEVPAPGSPEFLVFVSGGDGVVDPGALPMLTEVRRSLPGLRPVALGIGPSPTATDVAAVEEAGAARLVWAEWDRGPVGPGSMVATLESALRAEPGVVALALLSDGVGRLVGSTLAALRGLGMTGDAIGFLPGTGDVPAFLKPAFGGRHLAVIATRSRPAVVTVRPGALARGVAHAAAPMERTRLAVPPTVDPVEWVARGEEWDASWGDPRSAETVVVIGQGVGSPEEARRVRDIAHRWGAAVGATRRVVDLGWAPRQLQVGLTGLSIAPDLAVLVAVGGSVNHLTGLRRARTILAINRDPASAVFRRVDLGIVGEWSPVLDELTRRPRPS